MNGFCVELNFDVVSVMVVIFGLDFIIIDKGKFGFL